jgi:hypothetical protein
MTQQTEAVNSCNVKTYVALRIIAQAIGMKVNGIGTTVDANPWSRSLNTSVQ